MHYKLIKILITLLISLSGATASAGFRATGGGGAYLRDEVRKPIFLDLFLVQPDIQEHHDFQSKFKKNNVSESLGVDSFDVKLLPAFKKAKNLVLHWQKHSPLLAQFLLTAMDSIKFKFTFFGLKLTPTYHVPQEARFVETKNIAAAVLYDSELGVWISAPLWNQMGDESQTALILHETLRHIQLLYKVELSHQDIQNITATLVLQNPSMNFNLDSYLEQTPLLKPLSERAKEISEYKKQFPQQMCSSLSTIEDDLIKNMNVYSEIYIDEEEKLSQFPQFFCDKTQELMGIPSLQTLKLDELFGEHCTEDGKKHLADIENDDSFFKNNLSKKLFDESKFYPEPLKSKLLALGELILNKRISRDDTISPIDFLAFIGRQKSSACDGTLDMSQDGLFDASKIYHMPFNRLSPWSTNLTISQIAKLYSNLSLAQSSLELDLKWKTIGVDASHNLSRVFNDVAFELMKDYLNGNTRGLSASKKKEIKKLIQKAQASVKEMENSGILVVPYL